MSDTEEVPERERITFGEAIDWDEEAFGSVVKFGSGSKYDALSPKTVEELIEGNHLRPEESQNGAPSAQALLDFAKDVDADTIGVEVRLGGYMVSEERHDTRITLTSIRVSADERKVPGEIRERFLETFRRADKLDVDDEECYAWWD